MDTTRPASPQARGISADSAMPNTLAHYAAPVALRCTAGIIFGLLALYRPLLSLALLVLLLATGAAGIFTGIVVGVPAVAVPGIVRLVTALRQRREPGDHPAADEGGP